MLGADAVNWEVIDIYYNKKNKDGDEMDMSVVVQLNQTWQKLYDSQRNSKCIVFVTHAALKLYQKWLDWTGYELIIDEVPEATYTYTKNFKDTFDVFSRYVCIGKKDGAAYELDLTPAGNEAVVSNSRDSLVLTFMAVLQQIYYKNTKVWVKCTEWDNSSIEKLNFFSVFTPFSLEGFERVLLLGDKCAEMTIAHTWQSIWGVKFSQVQFKPKRKPRSMPVKDRCKVYYFGTKRPSIREAGSSAQPANKIAEYIKANEPETPLWTINSSARPKSKKLDELFGPENSITPKAHGINDRQHYKAALWLAAMNPNDGQAQQYKDYAGMTKEDIVKDRELNAIYQFVMRTNLRDWESNVFVNLYVWSQDQAEYLKERLGCEIEKIDNVIDETTKKVGRPKMANSLTSSQRGKKARLIKKYGEDEGLMHFEEWLAAQA